MQESAWQWLSKAVTGRSISIFLLLSFPALSPVTAIAKDLPLLTEPKLVSIFPLGGQRGTTVRAEVRGNLLDGSSAVWVDGGGLRGRVLRVSEVNEEIKGDHDVRETKPKDLPATYKAEIELEVPATVSLGFHVLRIVSVRGISDTVPFNVVSEKVVVEQAGSHNSVQRAQTIQFPAVINGRIEKPGELDYYSFEARQGQKISFEVVVAENCEPRLAMYRAGGSWFDSNQAIRLLFEEEKHSDLMSQKAKGTFLAPEDGEYFLEVSSLFGKGSPGSTYQVQVGSVEHSLPEATTLRQDAQEWMERNFTRELDLKWMAQLESRKIPLLPEEGPTHAEAATALGGTAGSAPDSRPKPTSNPPNHQPLIFVHGADDNSGHKQAVSLPAVFAGTIDHPGKVDSFRFKADAGETLVFEIETPDAKPPYFNPRLGVADSQDHELFSNVERVQSLFNNNADPQVYLNQVEPKANYSIEHAGEYTLQIRDITVRYGTPAFRYKVLVRPRVPHVGEVSIVEGDRINLVRGEPKKLTLTASYEEGFTGDLSFTFAGLPPGVEALPGIQYDTHQAPLERTNNADIVSPTQEKTTVLLMAGPRARLTATPVLVKLYGQPIEKGKLGPKLLVEEVPLMVIEPHQRDEKEHSRAGR